MSDSIRVFQSNVFGTMARADWEQELAAAPEHGRKRLAFMSDEHHAVRNHVVVELARQGSSLAPLAIAESLGLEVSRVEEILDELERKLFFLVRNDRGEVSWAFPVTVEETPHRLVFSTGERLYGA